jgi:hypothetical protein
MQIGIAAYLRNVAVRCNQIGRHSGDQQALAALCAELADKAQLLEDNFKGRRRTAAAHTDGNESSRPTYRSVRFPHLGLGGLCQVTDLSLPI